MSLHHRDCPACALSKCDFCCTSRRWHPGTQTLDARRRLTLPARPCVDVFTASTTIVTDLLKKRCPFCLALGDSCLNRMPMRRLGSAIMARRPETTSQELLEILCHYVQVEQDDSVSVGTKTEEVAS